MISYSEFAIYTILSLTIGSLFGWWMCKRLEPLPITEETLAALLPGPYYMDPPDGGDVPILKQLQRMSQDAARWRAYEQHGQQLWDAHLVTNTWAAAVLHLRQRHRKAAAYLERITPKC